MASNTDSLGHLGHPPWTIRKVNVNDQDFYLQRIKPFRLGALQQDPGAFGSSYGREVAFDEETWLARLRNPLAQTFAAVREAPLCQGTEQPEVLGTVTLYGPLPRSDGDDAFLAQNWPDERSDATDRDAVLVYHVKGVYTASENRGLGIGKTLLETAARHATPLPSDIKCVVIRVDVFASNLAAISFYSRSGFAIFEADGIKMEDGGRQTLSMYRSVDCDHD